MQLASIQEKHTNIEPDYTHRKARILVVEDDLTMGPLWKYIIHKLIPKAYVKWVTTEEAADRLINQRIKSAKEFDLIISDVFLSGKKTGIDLWKRYGHGNSLFLLMSAISPEKFTDLVGKNSPTPFYIQKPMTIDDYEDAITTLLEFRSLIPPT